VGSSSGRHCIRSMVYFTCIGVSSLGGRIVCLPENEPTRFETCRIHQKLNINLESCAFRWFVLCNYITMHGAKKEKVKGLCMLLKESVPWSFCYRIHTSNNSYKTKFFQKEFITLYCVIMKLGCYDKYVQFHNPTYCCFGTKFPILGLVV